MNKIRIKLPVKPGTRSEHAEQDEDVWIECEFDLKIVDRTVTESGSISTRSDSDLWTVDTSVSPFDPKGLTIFTFEEYIDRVDAKTAVDTERCAYTFETMANVMGFSKETVAAGLLKAAVFCIATMPGSKWNYEPSPLFDRIYHWVIDQFKPNDE